MIKVVSVLMVNFLMIGCGQQTESPSTNEVSPVQTPVTPPPVTRPPELESTVKKLTCSGKYRTHQWVFDANDFSKENPESEYSLVRLEGSDEESSFSTLLEGGLTNGELEGLGKVYRVTYDTTPQYLIFEKPRYPGCPYELRKMYEGQGDICDQTTKYSVSRETLNGEIVGTNPPITYKCEIESFDIKSNKI